MCSGTVTFDIALAASNTDIVENMLMVTPPSRMSIEQEEETENLISVLSWRLAVL